MLRHPPLSSSSGEFASDYGWTVTSMPSGAQS